MSQILKKVSTRINKEHYQFDLLSEVLETLKFCGSIFFRSTLASPWGFSLPEVNASRFHIAINGDCFMGVGENKVISMKHREIVILPHGDMHWIADQINRKLIPSKLAADACELGSPLFQTGKITNQLLCGLVQYKQELKHPLIQLLPSALHFSRIKSSDSVWKTVMLIESEIQENHQNTSIINRLTEVLFLQLINRYISEEKNVTGFVAALHNPRIHRLLELIHQNPHLKWSLSSLGDEISMSRATLSRQFKKSVGVAPMTYVTNWRMTKAHHLIKHSDLTLENIAETVGFSSARTLNKSFFRHYNYTLTYLRNNNNRK